MIVKLCVVECFVVSKLESLCFYISMSKSYYELFVVCASEFGARQIKTKRVERTPASSPAFRSGNLQKLTQIFAGSML